MAKRKQKEPSERGKLIEELKKLKIAKVEATYCGSGDSGAIESIEVFNADGQSIVLPDELKDKIDNEANDIIAAEHPGWEIDDGASGTITINVLKNKVKIEHTEYYTESRVSDSEEKFDA